MTLKRTAEYKRLAETRAGRTNWKTWGPYLSERAWGTAREDYSEDATPWDYFTFDHARSRAFRWNEDGIGGFCNDTQDICLSVALWNGHDPILKERFFGVSGEEGNHGEDVKDYFYYLDGTPTHSYMKLLYKYPQAEFPYGELVRRNKLRGMTTPEAELIDVLRETFEQNRYFDVLVEYAKADVDDMVCRISVTNKSSQPAPVHVLPHVWYRNTWAWGDKVEPPVLEAARETVVRCVHPQLGEWWWTVDQPCTLLFTDNETNHERLFDKPNRVPFTKDGIDEAVVNGRQDCVNLERRGTKAAAHITATVAAGETFVVHVRFSTTRHAKPFAGMNKLFSECIAEADDFYGAIQHDDLTAEERQVQRQALGALMWSKQYYAYDVERWHRGDAPKPRTAPTKHMEMNRDWHHLRAHDVLSIPDKWEYPWFAAWDIDFQSVTIALVDPEVAKQQLLILLTDRYLHLSGQIPSFEGGFDKANPPVHAWAAWHVYRSDRAFTGKADTEFLEQMFHKLLMNYTWWFQREEDKPGRIIQGGFLGMDNISIFDRSEPPVKGSYLVQADSAGWMLMFTLNMLIMALELAPGRPGYEHTAVMLLERFMQIAGTLYGENAVWDEQDGLFYDVLHAPDHAPLPLRTRSYVSLIPLLAVEVIDAERVASLPIFRDKLKSVAERHPELMAQMVNPSKKGASGGYALTAMSRERLERVLTRVLDSNEFLSEYGLRSLSRYHEDNLVRYLAGDELFEVKYEPGDAESDLMGGNSNWRGPLWAPINHLVIEALKKYHAHFGDTFTVEMPSGSGTRVTLEQAAEVLCQRLVSLFLPDEARNGYRPAFGDERLFQTHEDWCNHLWFYEHFHGETGQGLGASHQNGWTALVAKLLQDGGEV